jgi:4,5-dihydroxyphthalate decarboxylase
MSLSRYLIGVSNGDQAVVGIPVFIYRSFRHRCFFVREDSDLHSLAELAGRRVGTNSWPDTGNTWARAAIRDAGVDLATIEWVIAGIEIPAMPALPQGHLPPSAHIDGNHSLIQLLTEGTVDALMLPFPPSDFYLGQGIRRLLPDYQEAERDYYARARVYPAHHIVATRRAFFDEHPDAVVATASLIKESWRRWMQTRLKLSESTPWQLYDFERTIEQFGWDWQAGASSAEGDRQMLDTLCEEQSAQGLVASKVSWKEAFGLFYEAATEYPDCSPPG